MKTGMEMMMRYDRTRGEALADKIERHGVQVFGPHKLSKAEEQAIIVALRSFAQPEARPIIEWEIVDFSPESEFCSEPAIRGLIWHKGSLYAKRHSDGEWFATDFPYPLPQSSDT